MYLKKYLKVSENVKYFKKVIKYKYFSFQKVNYKYHGTLKKYLNTFKYKCI